MPTLLRKIPNMAYCNAWPNLYTPKFALRLSVIHKGTADDIGCYVRKTIYTNTFNKQVCFTKIS